MPIAFKEPTVIVSRRAYQRMVGYATRYANDSMDMKQWKEVYGILVGFIHDDRLVVVEDAIPMLVGGRAGVQFENKQYVDAAMIDEELFERGLHNGNKSDLFFCGWWHTHPGFSFFYSEVDTLTHLGYQAANKLAIGIIFDHTEKTAFDPGIEVIRLKNIDDGLLSDYQFLDYSLEDYENSIIRVEKLQARIKERMPGTEKILEQIQDLKKKEFAQLQRNYGLLLVPKYLTKEDKLELTEGEEDEELWEWNEVVLEAQYRIPKYRKKIEKVLSTLEKQSPKKRVKTLSSISDSLEKARSKWIEISGGFWKFLNKLAPQYLYLDTNERKIIEIFDARLRDYHRILDALRMRVQVSLAASKRAQQK